MRDHQLYAWFENFDPAIPELAAADRSHDAAGVDSALPAVRRLECAAELMEGAPDIARQKLDVQERPGTPMRVVVGSTSVFEVQNLGAGNRLVAPEQFPPCLKPGVVWAATEGPGRAAVPDQDLPPVEFECLGPGDVKLTTTTEVLVVV